MTKAIFLDRDGTINVDKKYVHKIDDFRFLPGVIDALQCFIKAGYILIIITNQSGIARGYFTENDYKRLMEWMDTQLRQWGIIITDTYYCPHHSEALIKEYRKDCECRKPGISLFEQAIKKYKIDVGASIAIGDRARDVTICDVYPIQGFVLYQKEERKQNNVSYIKGGLAEAASRILSEDKYN